MRKQISILILTTSALCLALLGVLTLNNEATLGDSTLTLTFTGDILPHQGLLNKAKRPSGYNFDFAFKNIKPLLSGSADICHLETPLSNSKTSGYPTFATPTEIVKSIAKAGWEGCDAASNHSYDQGGDGVRLTKKTFTENNLFLAGSAVDANDSAISFFSANNHTVALLAYTYGTNGIKLPSDEKASVNLININLIKRDIAYAVKRADLIVIHLHWGNEYQETPSKSQESLAKQLSIIPGVSLILGEHVHQLQRAEFINGIPVIFGMGNLWSGQGTWSKQPKGQIGALFKLTFNFSEGSPVKFSKGEVTSTYVDGKEFSIKLAGKANNPIACLARSEAVRLYSTLFKTEERCA